MKLMIAGLALVTASHFSECSAANAAEDLQATVENGLRWYHHWQINESTTVSAEVKKAEELGLIEINRFT